MGRVTYQHHFETDPHLRPDARREMWHAFGPGNPRDEPRQAARHNAQVQEPLPPIPAQLYIARCKTKEFLDGPESTPAAMDGMFTQYKDDPVTVPTFVYPTDTVPVPGASPHSDP